MMPAMWIRKATRILIGLALTALAVIGVTAELVPTLGVAPCGDLVYLASKEISQWASDF